MDEHSPVKPKGLVLTLSEVAALLRISRGSAYEAAKRGEIPTIRIGRRLLVSREAFDRLLATGELENRAQRKGDSHEHYRHE